MSVRETNTKDYVVGKLERAGVPKATAWMYYRAHQDKFVLMGYDRLNEWLESYIKALRSR